jgi:hypothetical protein
MKKRQRIRLRVVFVFSVTVLMASLMFSCEKVEEYEIKEVPSSVTWSEDVKDEIDAIRQSKSLSEAIQVMQTDNFTSKVFNEIPKKAKELNLSWADDPDFVNRGLYLFTAKDKLSLLDEAKSQQFKTNLAGYEPGFIVDHNGDHHHYLLESFTKVLNSKDLKLEYVGVASKRQQNTEADKVLRKVEFNSKTYPCSVHDNIHYWIRFAKENDIVLIGHGELPESPWKIIAYSEAQDHLDLGYIIALKLPENSSYVKMESGEEFIETPSGKMTVTLS